MIQWYPKDRASAQKMLDHPWLKMPDDYSFKMDDLEYKKYKFKQTFQGIDNEFLSGPTENKNGKKTKRQADYQEWCPGIRVFEGNISDLADSDSDINGGDCEDNVSLSSDSSGDSKSSHKEGGDGGSTSSDDSSHLNQSLSFVSENNRKKEEEFNLNVSFTGGYVPNTDLSRVDKGQGNPQFSGLEIKA